MKSWLQISLLLCIYGFLREMRPSEPFVIEYLTDSMHHITTEQINKEIYPFGTYAVLAQLIIVFLLTDIVRYKPMIIMSACSGIILFAIVLWTFTVWELQIGQIFYGNFVATEVAYYTYIYAKVDKNHYQAVTGHTRSAILCGKFLGGVLAQVLISTNAMDYRGLNYISFASVVLSLFAAIALPSVGRSLYFYTTEKIASSRGSSIANNAEMSNSTTISDSSVKFSWRNAFRLLWHHTVSAYTNKTVLKWSFWWALATCGQIQAISYIQILWKEIDENQQSYYNGAVEATVTLLGAAAAMTAGHISSTKLKHWPMLILTVCSLLMGGFLLICTTTHLLWVCYVMYVLFGICYYFMITIASAIVAENLSDDSFGLIFGINTLISLLLQVVLTLIVVTDTGFGLPPRGQYMVYSMYFISLGGFYALFILIQFIYNKCKTKPIV